MKILLLFERILRLKPCNRSKAAKAATGLTPCLKPGACAPPSGQLLRNEDYIKALLNLGTIDRLTNS